MTRQSRTVFTPDQLAILHRKFAGGMINHRKTQLIEEAATEAGLSIEKVKNWITNQNAKCKAAFVQKKSRATIKKRSLSGFNIFFRNFSNKGTIEEYLRNHPELAIDEQLSSANKMNMVISHAWGCLSDKERMAYEEEAKAVTKRVKAARIRQQMIDHSFKTIQEHGCHAVFAIFDGHHTPVTLYSGAGKKAVELWEQVHMGPDTLITSEALVALTSGPEESITNYSSYKEWNEGERGRTKLAFEEVENKEQLENTEMDSDDDAESVSTVRSSSTTTVRRSIRLAEKREWNNFVSKR
ncbi:4831_t:CDS:2 [Paraglomus brasilianum]|uniref:4831_t:CDS:1 n=1 Tax=Paraglomus brasilianum TaxID=144538 RepID=A0A9N8ZT73_9GLOM|nr:4831_t:CDS:2 [Paraglomus brasilianum]